MGKKGKGKKGSGDNKEENTAVPKATSSGQRDGNTQATSSAGQQSSGRGRGQQVSQQVVGIEQQAQPTQQSYGRGQQQQQQQQPAGVGQQPSAKGRGKKHKTGGPPPQQPGGSLQVEQAADHHAQQEPRDPPPQQQQQPKGPPPQQQQQPKGPPPQQQQQPRGPPPQQQPWGPPPQQQPWGPQQQPRGPTPQQQQQPRGPTPQQQQQPRGPTPQQQQQPRGSTPQQQPRGPTPQQQPPWGPAPQQQQPWGPAPQQQQPWGPAPQQQQPRGPAPQQFRGPAPQQQQFRGPAPQHQQPWGPAPQQQQPRGPAPQQQQHRGPAPQQQQPRGPAPQQQQPRGPAPQQQQPWGPPQQQQPWGSSQQQHARGPLQQEPQTAWGRGQQPHQAGDGGQQQGGSRGRGRGDRQQSGQLRQGVAPEQQQVDRGRQSQESSRPPSTTPSESSVKSDTRRRPAPASAQPSRESTPASVEDITATLQKPGLNISSPTTSKTKVAEKHLELEIPQRKNIRQGGKTGTPIAVEVNHVALNFKFGNESAVHYDVAITPDNPKRLMRRVWIAFKEKYLPQFPLAFDDFKNAYSPRPLPFTNDIGGEVEVSEDGFGRPRQYKVVMKYAASVNLRELMNYMATGGRFAVPQEALQCIDIVLRNCSAMRFTKVGRSFFSPPRGRIVQLGDGLELWHGFFQSAVIGWKPFLNVDVAHKGFPIPQSVLQLIAEMSSDRNRQCREGEIDEYKVPQIQSFLKGLKILYELPNQPGSRRSYRVNGLKGHPSETTFEIDESKTKMTITEYYYKMKGYKIKYGNIPVLWVGPRDRNIYLPAELCTIMSGQVINRKLNEIQTAQMVRSAATSTNVRKQKIMDSLSLANFNADPVVQAFGMNVGSEFERVKARVLNPPRLQYGRNCVTQPRKGTWHADVFLEPSNVSCWTVINLDRRTKEDNVSEFTRNIKAEANQLGISIGEALRPFVKFERFNVNDLRNTFDKLKKNGVKIAFVIIPDFPSNVYSQVKQTSELAVGLVTQCIKSKTMFRMSPATIKNILLKVNAKMNGLNHTIANVSRPQCLEEPCMIMGADVTHPSPDQNDIPSVAAVTASCDPKAFKYNFCWRLQPARQEIIVDLEEIVIEQLRFFYKQTNQKPRRIIFFRDGVSEGQFREVMNMEVQAIKRACKSMPGGITPPITFLVVQKRHHTRFFPREGETDDRNNNVRAGTVVDTEITHPTSLEYYLVSHASIQGVARPTKYRVLWDDSNMMEDELEHLTYYLCHLFSRCTRSVSYPAPTYYAHLAAFRARVYLEGRSINLDNLPNEQKNRTIKEEISKNFPMFFV